MQLQHLSAQDLAHMYMVAIFSFVQYFGRLGFASLGTLANMMAQSSIIFGKLRWKRGLYRKQNGESGSDQDRQFGSANLLAMGIIVTFLVGVSLIGQSRLMGSRFFRNGGTINHFPFLKHVVFESVLGYEREKWEQGLYRCASLALPYHENYFGSNLNLGGILRIYIEREYKCNSGWADVLLDEVEAQWMPPPTHRMANLNHIMGNRAPGLIGQGRYQFGGEYVTTQRSQLEIWKGGSYIWRFGKYKTVQGSVFNSVKLPGWSIAVDFNRVMEKGLEELGDKMIGLLTTELWELLKRAL